MRINADSLKHWREQAGYTQAMLAREAGVSQGHISDLEAGVKTVAGEKVPVGLDVRPSTAKRLADALGVGIPDITLPDESEVAS